MHTANTPVMQSVVQKFNGNEYQSILNDTQIAGVGKNTLCDSVIRRIC